MIPQQVYNLSNQTFDLIRDAQRAGLDPFVCSTAADRLFECFGPQWQRLYFFGFQLAASNLWGQVLDWANTYERTQNQHIHKGTALFFLGRNLLVQGDVDAAFSHVYAAMEEDKDVANSMSQPNRYKASPAYMTVTIVDDKKNALFDLVVEPIRHAISTFASSFSTTLSLSNPFTIQNFETSFLSKSDLEHVVFFFVYNMYNHVSRSRFGPAVRKNDLLKLKSLDSFFNICLVIEEVLKKRFQQIQPAGRGRQDYYITDGICELAGLKTWIPRGEDKTQFLNRLSDIDLRKDPSITIPILFAGNPLYSGGPLRQEMKFLLLAWHLRNYGGHNISVQDILLNDYDRIFEWLIYALFVALG